MTLAFSLKARLGARSMIWITGYEVSVGAGGPFGEMQSKHGVGVRVGSATANKLLAPRKLANRSIPATANSTAAITSFRE